VQALDAAAWLVRVRGRSRSVLTKLRHAATRRRRCPPSSSPSRTRSRCSACGAPWRQRCRVVRAADSLAPRHCRSFCAPQGGDARDGGRARQRRARAQRRGQAGACSRAALTTHARTSAHTLNARTHIDQAHTLTLLCLAALCSGGDPVRDGRAVEGSWLAAGTRMCSAAEHALSACAHSHARDACACVRLLRGARYANCSPYRRTSGSSRLS
jgi:hypothetical protein